MTELTTEYQSNISNKKRIDQNKSTYDKNVEPFKIYLRIKPLEDSSSSNIYHHLRLNKKVISTIKTYKEIDSNKKHYYRIKVINPCLLVQESRKEKEYILYDVFDENIKNRQISNHINKGVTSNMLNGINTSIIAYGVTGSGKTHTLFGNKSLKEEGVSNFVVEDFLNKIHDTNHTEATYKVKLSYYEIYNEEIEDLLDNIDKSNKKQSFKKIDIFEDDSNEITISNMTQININSFSDFKNSINYGNIKRSTAATNKNNFSSRSHAVIELVLYKSNNDINCVVSKLKIIDLAGSEKGGIESGERAREGVNINKSLLALSSCINILADNNDNKNLFVPYRNSKLTRILKDSLGGNSQVIFITCISQSPLNWEETNNTLYYALKVMKIKKEIFVNPLKNENKRNKSEMDKNRNTTNILISSVNKLKSYRNIAKLKINKEQEMTKSKSVNKYFFENEEFNSDHQFVKNYANNEIKLNNVEEKDDENNIANININIDNDFYEIKSNNISKRIHSKTKKEVNLKNVSFFKKLQIDYNQLEFPELIKYITCDVNRIVSLLSKPEEYSKLNSDDLTIKIDFLKKIIMEMINLLLNYSSFLSEIECNLNIEISDVSSIIKSLKENLVFIKNSLKFESENAKIDYINKNLDENEYLLKSYKENLEILQNLKSLNKITMSEITSEYLNLKNMRKNLN